MSHKSSKTAEEKLAIVLEGLKGGITVSDLCRKYGLSQAVYYKWRDKFLDGGKKGLMNSGELSLVNPDKSKLEEYEKVIGKQTIEIQILKKNLKMKLGISVSYNRVYRIMKKNDLLVDRKRYKAKRTTQKDKPKPVKINQWWGTDMTKFYVQSFGWVY